MANTLFQIGKLSQSTWVKAPRERPKSSSQGLYLFLSHVNQWDFMASARRKIVFENSEMQQKPHPNISNESPLAHDARKIIPPSSTLCINWEKVPESSSITSETTRTQAKRYPYPRGVGERTMKNDTYIYRDSLVKSPQWEPSIPLQRALNQTIPIYIIYIYVYIYVCTRRFLVTLFVFFAKWPLESGHLRKMIKEVT